MENAIPLCKLTDIPDGGAKGIVIGSRSDAREVIVLRRENKIFAYVNRCPHKGTPLETFPDRFLDQTGELLVCSTHGARFRVMDGKCVEGPCEGASLEPLRVRLRDGKIMLAGADSA